MRAWGLLLLAVALPAGAAITCSASLTPISVVYDPIAPTQNVTTGSYTVSCVRLTTDPNSFAWQLGVDDGLQPGGGTNRVVGGNKRYGYDTYRASPYSSPNLWGDTATTRFTGTLSFGGSLTASMSGAFDVVMAAQQNGQPAGTYTDTMTASLRNSAGTAINAATFGVSVLTTNTCQISVPPGNLAFAYSSFQPAPAAASTTYGVRCTTSLPYSMSLDAPSGTLLGVNYTLTLAPQSFGIGTGATQSYSINGIIAGGQAGTCAAAVCTGTQTRTLTLSW